VVSAKTYVMPERFRNLVPQRDSKYDSTPGVNSTKYAVLSLEKVAPGGTISKRQEHIPLDTPAGRGRLEYLYLNTAKLKGLYQQGPESGGSSGGFNDF